MPLLSNLRAGQSASQYVEKKSTKCSREYKRYIPPWLLLVLLNEGACWLVVLLLLLFLLLYRVWLLSCQSVTVGGLLSPTSHRNCSCQDRRPASHLWHGPNATIAKKLWLEMAIIRLNLISHWRTNVSRRIFHQYDWLACILSSSGRAMPYDHDKMLFWMSPLEVIGSCSEGGLNEKQESNSGHS